MTQLQAVAKTLRNQGFKTKIEKNSVFVSLNRKINNMEIRTALDTEMDNINFRLTSAGNEIKVNL